MIEFDILIVSHSKDANKIPYVLKSIDKLRTNNNIKDIHLIVDNPENFPINDVIIHKEIDILKVPNVKYRPKWIYQQFLKLFQDVTQNNYLSIDADVIFNKPIEIFPNDRPKFFLGRDQYHHQYFDFMEKFGITRSFHRSFINEVMLFKKSMINSMIMKLGFSQETFIKKCEEIISEQCQLSEFELYGNFVISNYPEEYGVKQLNAPLMGKSGPWENSEIEENIRRIDGSNVDFFTIHTWN